MNPNRNITKMPATQDIDTTDIYAPHKTLLTYQDFSKMTLGKVKLRKRPPESHQISKLYSKYLRMAFFNSMVTSAEVMIIVSKCDMTKYFDGETLVNNWKAIKERILSAWEKIENLPSSEIITWDKYARLINARQEIAPLDTFYGVGRVAEDDYNMFLRRVVQPGYFSGEEILPMIHGDWDKIEWLLLEMSYTVPLKSFLNNAIFFDHGHRISEFRLKRIHDVSVRTALDFGKSVPPTVLLDYPDFCQIILNEHFFTNPTQNGVELAILMRMEVPQEVLINFPELITIYGFT